MLQYAARHNGAGWGRIVVMNAGKPDEMVAAFRSGVGDYVHLQGPAAHQLEQESVGTIVVSVGASMPEVAFSSLTAAPEFLETQEGRVFLRAYAKAREWVRTTPAEDVARKEASFFPDFTPEVLTAAVRAYQSFGCWAGGIEISRQHYEQALNVFEALGVIPRRYPYDIVVHTPLSGGRLRDNG